MDENGKVIVITGASSGIGRAAADLLGAQGHRLVLGGRDSDRLDAVVDAVVAAGGQASGVRSDVRERADVERLVVTATDRYGHLDVLVSNAGIGRVAPLDDLQVADWDEMIDINLRGLLYGIAAALPVFRAQGGGHFVTTLSTSGIKIVPDQAVYAATKNAARTVCEALRQEAGPTIRVTTVSPGMIDTPFAATGATNPDSRDALLERVRRLAISPAAIARAMAYAINEPPDVDVNEIVVRPTAQA